MTPERRPLTYEEITPAQGWKVQPLFAWYAMLVGAFWDRKKREMRVFPLPCIGFVITWPRHAFRILDQDSIDRLLGFTDGEAP